MVTLSEDLINPFHQKTKILFTYERKKKEESSKFHNGFLLGSKINWSNIHFILNEFRSAHYVTINHTSAFSCFVKSS